LNVEFAKKRLIIIVIIIVSNVVVIMINENVFCELCLKNQIKKKEVENKKIRKYNKAIQKAIKN